MNRHKTGIMKVGRIKEECNIYFENIKLKQTDTFSYPGVLLDDVKGRTRHFNQN